MGGEGDDDGRREYSGVQKEGVDGAAGKRWDGFGGAEQPHGFGVNPGRRCAALFPAVLPPPLAPPPCPHSGLYTARSASRHRARMALVSLSLCGMGLGARSSRTASVGILGEGALPYFLARDTRTESESGRDT